MNLKTKSFLTLCVISLSSVSFASEVNTDSNSLSPYLPGLTAKVGTLGAGLDLTIPVMPDNINARVGVSGFRYSYDVDISSTSIGADLTIFNVSLLADYHPFQGGFRITAGGVYNGNKLDVSGRPNGTINFNGIDYAVADVGHVDAKVDFMPIAPYFGLGWGNAANKDSSFHFAFDIGAIYQGTPNVTMNASCGSALPAAQCSTLRASANAEAEVIEDNLKFFKFYPVVQLGVSYSF
ncbi:MAG: hypothetical protein OEX11_04325 [Nitrosomonas sp.]|nr:hypothetical protein [Nitrosomonas sp.]